MDYEELVAAIAHIDAAKEVMGLSCPDNVSQEVFDGLDGTRNELNRVRLAMLGNGQDRPFHVADLKLT